MKQNHCFFRRAPRISRIQGEQRQIKNQQTRKMTLHFGNTMYRIPFEKSSATLAVHLELP